VRPQLRWLALAAYEFGERVAELVPRSVSPNGIVFRILLVHFFRSVVPVEDSAQDRRGARSDRAIVEIDFIFGDDELLAHFGPEGVFILVEKRMVGKRRNFLELGEQIAADGE